MKALVLVEFIFRIQTTNSDLVTWELSSQKTEAILHPNFLSRAPPTVIPLVYSALNVESSLAFPVLTSLPHCYVFSGIGFSGISDTCLLSYLYSPSLVQALWVGCDAHLTSSSCYLVSSNNLYIPLPFKFQSAVGSHLFSPWSLHGFPPVVSISVHSPSPCTSPLFRAPSLSSALAHPPSRRLLLLLCVPWTPRSGHSARSVRSNSWALVPAVSSAGYALPSHGHRSHPILQHSAPKPPPLRSPPAFSW